MRGLLVVLFLAVSCLQAPAQVHQGQTLVTPSLVADTTAIVPGKPFQVGLLLKMAPTWHTYWQYGGDAGFPTTLDWTLPPGFAAGPIEWPLPERLKEPGDIEVYAYGDETMLLVTIVPPSSLAEKTVTLRAKSSWLVCAEICIPGKADLELTLPVAPSAEPANQELFARYRAELPSAEPPPYKLAWTKGKDGLGLEISGLPPSAPVDVFPIPAADQQVQHPATTVTGPGSAVVAIPGVDSIQGVLVVGAGGDRRGWMISSSDTVEAAVTPMPQASAAPGSGAAPAVGSASGTFPLWKALLFGFLGGIILNLMPCVLPVISLKIFGFIRQAGEHPAKIFRHGLAFAAGIFAWFLGLGALIVALQAAGNHVTWAFQFQNPWFNFFTACIVFVFALNLFGVFEIILPGQASNALAEASSGSGYAGSFFQGVFATLLATPCTAPFLGPALGFALSQSAVVIFAMFASVSLGMAAPYLLLSAQPGWMKVLPRPGAWMERLKQFMGFPLIATLVWLLSVIGGQKGLGGVIWTLAFLVCLGLACWIYGSFCGPLTKPATRLLAIAAALAIIALGAWQFVALAFVQSQPPTATAETPAGKDGIDWVPFSQKALDDLRAKGTPVFVDFTADWCISCKFNERTAINVPAVRQLLRDRGIVAMKADWTNANPEITAALQAFGRAGVPFYVFYPANHAEPVTLPELLTQAIVLNALSK